MTEYMATPDKKGVVIGPLHKSQNADQMATNIFKLLMTLGIRCSDISHVLVNPKAGCAKIEVYKSDCEDYLIKVLKEVTSIMSLYDLRKLLENPERLVVVRIRQVIQRQNYQEITDGGTSTFRPTAGENMPLSLRNEKLETTISDKSKKKVVSCDVVANSAVLNIVKSSETTSSLHIEFEELEEEEESRMLRHEATSTSDIRQIDTAHKLLEVSSLDSTQKPIMINAKTSTPLVYPCGCPETVFYHQEQHIGAETRYAEFKKGGVIHEQRKFVQMVARYVCGFLNTQGGTLYLGVNDEGIVLGIAVDKSMEDNLRLDIDFAIRLIEPTVDMSEYSVNFARVMTTSGVFSPDLKVLEVCIKPRKQKDSRYSYNDVIYIRRDGSLQSLSQQNVHDSPTTSSNITKWDRQRSFLP